MPTRAEYVYPTNHIPYHWPTLQAVAWQPHVRKVNPVLYVVATYGCHLHLHMPYPHCCHCNVEHLNNALLILSCRQTVRFLRQLSLDTRPRHSLNHCQSVHQVLLMSSSPFFPKMRNYRQTASLTPVVGLLVSRMNVFSENL